MTDTNTPSSVVSMSELLLNILPKYYLDNMLSCAKQKLQSCIYCTSLFIDRGKPKLCEFKRQCSHVRPCSLVSGDISTLRIQI